MESYSRIIQTNRISRQHRRSCGVVRSIMPPFRGGDPGSNPGTSTIFPEDVVTLYPSNIGTSTLSQIHLIYLNVEGLSLGCGKPVR